jgi:hypothetical protein
VAILAPVATPERRFNFRTLSGHRGCSVKEKRDLHTNRTDVIQKRCGAVVGLGVGSKMGTGSRLRHIERRGDPMNRARSRLVMHIIYDGCTLASAQYCSVSGNILTGDSSERIESPPCRVPATTVAGSRHGSPVEHCPLQHDEGSQRLRRRVGHSGERHNGRMRRDEWQPSISI